VVFVCPLTRHDARTGIHMDRQSFGVLGHLVTRFACACGAPHRLRLDEARLTPLCGGSAS
jgi:hypothetical protein